MRIAAILGSCIGLVAGCSDLDSFSWTGGAVLVDKSAACETTDVVGAVFVPDAKLEFNCAGYGEDGSGGHPENTVLRSATYGVEVELIEGSCNVPESSLEEECAGFDIAGTEGRHRLSGSYCQNGEGMSINNAYLGAATWTWHLPATIAGGQGCTYTLEIGDQVGDW